MGPLMINMTFMPLYMWEMWDVTPVTNARTDTRTVESSAVFSLSWIRNNWLWLIMTFFLEGAFLPIPYHNTAENLATQQLVCSYLRHCLVMMFSLFWGPTQILWECAHLLHRFKFTSTDCNNSLRAAPTFLLTNIRNSQAIFHGLW